jgi:hypothetical protein
MFERDLLEHCGGREQASLAQKLMINRLSRVALRLELMDDKLAAGTATELDVKIYGSLHTQYRMMLRDLGLKSQPRRPPSLADLKREAREAARHGAAA